MISEAIFVHSGDSSVNYSVCPVNYNISLKPGWFHSDFRGDRGMLHQILAYNTANDSFFFHYIFLFSAL